MSEAEKKVKIIFHPIDEDSPKEQRRKKIRFKPDHNTIAYAKLFEENIEDGVDSFIGLVIDESHHGCKIAFLDHAPIKAGDHLYLAVGALPVVIAEVKWRKSAGASLTEIGFEYISK